MQKKMLGILLLGVGLRLIHLNGRPLWYDEAFSVLPWPVLVAGTIGSPTVTAEPHPLLYYFLLSRWTAVAGTSPLAIRLLSVFFGLLTIALIYRLGRTFFDPQTGWVAAFITTIAPFSIYYSQEARMYSLLGLSCLATLYFLGRGWQTGKWQHWLGFSLAGATALYSHNLALFFVFSLLLWLFWQSWRQAKGYRLPFMASLLLLLLYAPWVSILGRQLGQLQKAYWVTKPGLVEIVQTVYVWHFSADNQGLPALWLPIAIFSSFLFLAVVGLESRKWLSKPLDKLLLWATVLPVVACLLVSQWIPVYVIRATLPAALLYYLVLGRVWVAGTVPKPVRYLLAILALTVIGASLLYHYNYQNFPRAPYVELVTFLQQESQAEDLILHENKLSYLPARYYAPTLSQKFIADPPGSPQDTLAPAIRQAIGSPDLPNWATALHDQPQRVWWIHFVQQPIEPDSLIEGYDQQAEYLFGSLQLELWQKRSDP